MRGARIDFYADPWLSKMHPVKILIRLRRCAGFFRAKLRKIMYTPVNQEGEVRLFFIFCFSLFVFRFSFFDIRTGAAYRILTFKIIFRHSH